MDWTLLIIQLFFSAVIPAIIVVVANTVNVKWLKEQIKALNESNATLQCRFDKVVIELQYLQRRLNKIHPAGKEKLRGLETG